MREKLNDLNLKSHAKKVEFTLIKEIEMVSTKTNKFLKNV
jgi:hypothetical protein